MRQLSSSCGSAGCGVLEPGRARSRRFAGHCCQLVDVVIDKLLILAWILTAQSLDRALWHAAMHDHIH